jgi:VWFA-related protein
LLVGGAQTVFKSGVFLVQLDISVLDSDRRPIRGLTAADFTVLEDGKPQKIAAFAAIEVPAPSAPAAAWMRSIAPDVRTNEEAKRPEGRLFVILLDDAMIPFEPAAIRSAKEVARRIVDGIGPADRVAVVFSAGSRGTQNFTGDRARLLAAIETLNASYAIHTLGWDTAPPAALQGLRGAPPPVPMTDPDITWRVASMTTLRNVAESLIAAPERRKLLIYVSPGIGVDTSSASTPTLASANGRPIALKQANADLFHQMSDLFRRMRLANVTIYPVDPCGLGGLESYALRVASGLPALRGATQPPPPSYDWLMPTQPPAAEFLARHIATVNMDFLMASASNTGGKAIVNTNEFESGINQIFAENGSYYLIGYAPPDRNGPGSLHRLEVRVNRRDVSVRTRNGYAMPEAERAERGNPQPTAAMKAVAGPVARGDLPLRVALSPVAGSDGPVVSIVLGLTLPPVSARTSQLFELRTSAFTPDGQPRGSQRHSATVTVVPNDSGDGARFELLSKFALKPGRYELRLGAHRTTDDLWGSVYADVDVPDFAAAPLSLSGVMIETSPAIAAAPRAELAALVPIVPTASREFSATDRAAGFLRVYQGGAGAVVPATVAVRIVNERDERVVETTDTIAADRFDASTRAADYRFLVPTTSLPAGEYLLTFDVTAGVVTTARTVRFTMR